MSDNEKKFRHNAGFGKRIEFSIIAQLLKEGRDVYIPLVDDIGIDAVIRKPDGTFVELQIKARSEEVNAGDEALFAAIRHEYHPNYWFIFHAEKIFDESSGKYSPVTWVLSSREFINESYQNKKGKNIGLRTIWFNGTKNHRPYAKKRFDKYRVKPNHLSDRILNENPDTTGLTTDTNA